ncbi:MAG: GTPase HflX, partial [Planctomycetes bacterium]|nr:GTPase HflX [Planctomycetota bacterium]
VELAQAEYMRPRLTRMWTHLERTEGAIGARGPGETQLETDRRLINRKISDLKLRLAEIEARSRRQAQSRTEVSTISLVGYTNAGKSSLMKALTGADVFIADQMFATLDTRVRRWDLSDGRAVLLADTVGFVRDLPHHLVASFHATLEETLNADLLLHVCDATDPDLEVHLRAVEEVLSVLGGDQIPALQILNKADLLPPLERELVCRRFPDAVVVSAVKGSGLPELEQAVAAVLDRWSLRLALEVPASAGRLLAELRRHGKIEAEAFEGETWTATIRLLPRNWNPLRIEVERSGGRFSTAPA